ncbi:hypothetical protein ZIOFF_012659 [Zingiber officinale]|uniref:Uncharacterized protein n=1 Tax=Zingiber officinale TaxID=94328 RepID=A0A8J5I092_ZINOF|nr:hypothetical protein ZIOFF_012659 [Zingiber officinale]
MEGEMEGDMDMRSLEDGAPLENGDSELDERFEGDGGDRGEEEREEDDGGEEEEWEEDDGEEEEEGYTLLFDGDMDPIGFAQDENHGIELYQKFERREYEALAERKRKALQERPAETIKKSRREEVLGITTEEINELMNFGRRRRRRACMHCFSILNILTHGAINLQSAQIDIGLLEFAIDLTVTTSPWLPLYMYFNLQPKKRGRKQGSKNKVCPEVDRKMMDAIFHIGSKVYDEHDSIDLFMSLKRWCFFSLQALPLLKKIMLLAPNLSEAYYLLGVIYDAKDDREKALTFHMIAAHSSPKDSAIWKKLAARSVEQNSTGQLRYFLKKAITADPKDVYPRFELAWFYYELGEYQEAAETYDRICGINPASTLAYQTLACQMAAKV